MYHAHTLGKFAEDKACNYLQQQGLILLTQNYRCRFGEVDLIMQDGAVLVFVEVRIRRDQDLMMILESITPSKQSKIIRAATFYLQEKHLFDKTLCRFDVVAGVLHDEKIELKWIKQAFDVIY